MPKSPAVVSAIGKVGAAARYHGSDDRRTREARRVLAAQLLEEHIRRAVDGAPPLTPDQREKLAELLAPARGAAQK